MKKTICSVILDSLIAQMLHTTHWELRTYDPSECVYNDGFDDDNKQGQHFTTFYLHFNFHSIVSCSFCIILYYIFYILTEHICYIAALFVCFLLLCSATARQDIQICFGNPKKTYEIFVQFFFSEMTHKGL